MGKSRLLAGLGLIVITILFSYMVTFFYTESEELKVKFWLNPGEWEYLSIYLWRISISFQIAVMSFVIYLFTAKESSWIRAAFLSHFIIESVMVLNYILTRNQIDIEPFIILWMGFTLIVASREVKWIR